MVSPAYDPLPQRPLRPSEALRIGSALQPFGLPYGPGYPHSEMWIAMESEVPHRLLGIRGTRDEALALLDSRVQGASAAEVYGPFSPPPSSQRYLDVSSPCVHDDTSMVRTRSDVGDIRLLQRQHAEMKSLTITIEWEHRAGKPDTATINVGPHADTIFLTRASREAFAYPRYLAIFGPEYVARIREDLEEI